MLVPRVLLRFTSKHPGHIPGTSVVEQLLASTSHYVMYGFVFAMPVSGALMGLMGPKGLPLFDYSIPPLPQEYRVKDLAGKSYEFHKVAGKALEYFLALHVAGAFFHVVRGQAIFSRIVPGLASKAPK